MTLLDLAIRPLLGLNGDPRFVRQPASNARHSTIPVAPRADCLETDVADLLDQLDLDYLYEPFFYPLAFRGRSLEPSFGFSPDFWLPATARRPEVHVEVTMVDAPAHGCRGCGIRPKHRPRSEIDVEHYAKKHRKINGTRKLYGLGTVLVTHSVLHQVRRDPASLREMIRLTAGAR
ncbi:MAG TPA: hypothetical protein VLG27_03940 [Candidatus Saccharimonadia bacterium]|nr:hypothetical protein [Candidatus Saccharimonadia bacterium]